MRNHEIADKYDLLNWLKTLVAQYPEIPQEAIKAQVDGIKREIRHLIANQTDPLAKSLRDGGKRAAQPDPEGGYYTFWCEPDDPDRTYEETTEYVDSEYEWHSSHPGQMFTRAWFYRNQLGLWIITYTNLDI